MLHGFQLSLPPAKPFVPMPMTVISVLVQRLCAEEEKYAKLGDREMAAMSATQRAFICTTTYMASRGNETEDITPNGFFRKTDPSSMHHTRDVLARTLDGEFEADGEILCFRNSNKPLSRKKQLILPHPLRTAPMEGAEEIFWIPAVRSMIERMRALGVDLLADANGNAYLFQRFTYNHFRGVETNVSGGNGSRVGFLDWMRREIDKVYERVFSLKCPFSIHSLRKGMGMFMSGKDQLDEYQHLTSQSTPVVEGIYGNLQAGWKAQRDVADAMPQTVAQVTPVTPVTQVTPQPQLVPLTEAAASPVTPPLVPSRPVVATAMTAAPGPRPAPGPIRRSVCVVCGRWNAAKVCGLCSQCCKKKNRGACKNPPHKIIP